MTYGKSLRTFRTSTRATDRANPNDQDPRRTPARGSWAVRASSRRRLGHLIHGTHQSASGTAANDGGHSEPDLRSEPRCAPLSPPPLARPSPPPPPPPRPNAPPPPPPGGGGEPLGRGLRQR